MAPVAPAPTPLPRRPLLSFYRAAPAGVGPRIFFQQVPEPKSIKNRVHLDVNVGGGLDAARAEGKFAAVLQAREGLLAFGVQPNPPRSPAAGGPELTPLRARPPARPAE